MSRVRLLPPALFVLVSGLCASGRCCRVLAVHRVGHELHHDCTGFFAERVRDHGSVTSLSHLDRITVDPVLCHGKPTVRGLRVTVQSTLDLLASGMTLDEVLVGYPYLER